MAGKFEFLKNSDGNSSLKIDQKNRLIFKIYKSDNSDYALILQLRGHYDDK